MAALDRPQPGRRAFLTGAAALAAAPFAPRFALRRRRRAKPNVLFVMTDQHHWSALACSGNDQIVTPSLDRLASEGVRFSSAIAASGQGGPSRYSIWTGTHVRTHRLLRNGNRGNVDLPTVGELLRDEGYRTASIGKHLVRPDDLTSNHGFDTVVERKDYEAFLVREDRRNNRGRSQGNLRHSVPGLQAGPSLLPNAHHESAFWVDRAAEFIAEDETRPFCACVSFLGPGSPIQPSDPWASGYKARSLDLPPNYGHIDPEVPGLGALREKQDLKVIHQKQILGLYYGYVSQIDQNVGRLFDVLDSAGRAQDTLVVFTADHGEMMGEHGVWTTNFLGYDGTLRVPLIARLPEELPAGTVREDVVSSVDLLPSILRAAGVDAPETLQGVPSLFEEGDEGEAGAEARRFAYAETGVADKHLATVCRTKDAKHVRLTVKGELVLEQYFDLVADPWETKNEFAAAREDGRLEPLRERHEAWLAGGGEEP